MMKSQSFRGNKKRVHADLALGWEQGAGTERAQTMAMCNGP